MVHSSLASLGFVPGGVRTIIRGLREAIGPDGTLVMPTHTWEWMSRGCRTFDARVTPSCVGALGEAFRRLPETVRSLHPTHSLAAWGPQAADLVADHEFATTPCGEGTPYARLINAGAQVLFLGVGLESNTLFHTLEAIAGVPYLLRGESEQFTLIDAEGHKEVRTFRRHADGIARRFGETEALLCERGVVCAGRVGCARTLLAESTGLADAVLRMLRDDPSWLLAASAKNIAFAGTPVAATTNA